MVFDLVLEGGTVASSEGVTQADVGIVGDRIAELGSLGARKARRKIDVRGLMLLPGPIDSQVHFREPGMEHKEDIESGTRAALAGGVTTIFEMPNTSPPTVTAEALQDKLDRAAETASCNYGFFVGASPENASDLARLERLPGTPGVKMFVGSSTGSLLVADDASVKRAMLSGHKRITVHSEDHFRLVQRKREIPEDADVHWHPVWRDPQAAVESTRRLLALCAETARPLHILHISTAEECEILWDAKRRGLNVTCEVTPQHLTFAAPEAYDRWGTLVQMNPPIRSAEHRDRIRCALKEGLFCTIGSDHAPHTLEEKVKPFPSSPSGMPGVQTLLPVMLDFVNQGVLELTQLVQLLCENPASIFGVIDRGKIAPGMIADITAVDLNAKRPVEASWLQYKCGWSPFEGQELTGWPVHVVLGGEVALEDGEIALEKRGKQISFTEWNR
ncbi:MAG: dihydroorotase [Fimbriimonadaceae bacterium]